MKHGKEETISEPTEGMQPLMAAAEGQDHKVNLGPADQLGGAPQGALMAGGGAIPEHKPETLLPGCSDPGQGGQGSWTAELRSRAWRSGPGTLEPMLSAQEGMAGGALEADTGESSGPQRSNARGRVRLTAAQTEILESFFRFQPYIRPEARARLAQATKLELQQVSIWFQNKRARLKLKQGEGDVAGPAGPSSSAPPAVWYPETRPRNVFLEGLMESLEPAMAAEVASAVAVQDTFTRDSQERYESLKVEYDQVVQRNEALQQQVAELQEQLLRAQLIPSPTVPGTTPVAARPAQVPEGQSQISSRPGGPASPSSLPSSESSGAAVRAHSWTGPSSSIWMPKDPALSPASQRSWEPMGAGEGAGQSNHERSPAQNDPVRDPCAVSPTSPSKKFRFHKPDTVTPCGPRHTRHRSAGSASGGHRPEAPSTGRLAARKDPLRPLSLVVPRPSALDRGRPQGGLQRGKRGTAPTPSLDSLTGQAEAQAQGGGARAQGGRNPPWGTSWSAPLGVPQSLADWVQPPAVLPPGIQPAASSAAGQAGRVAGTESALFQKGETEGVVASPTGQPQESSTVPRSPTPGNDANGEDPVTMTAGLSVFEDSAASHVDTNSSSTATEAFGVDLPFPPTGVGHASSSLDAVTEAQAELGSSQMSLSDSMRVTAAFLVVACGLAPGAELNLAPGTSPDIPPMHLEGQPSGNEMRRPWIQDRRTREIGPWMDPDDVAMAGDNGVVGMSLHSADTRAVGTPQPRGGGPQAGEASHCPPDDELDNFLDNLF